MAQARYVAGGRSRQQGHGMTIYIPPGFCAHGCGQRALNDSILCYRCDHWASGYTAYYGCPNCVSIDTGLSPVNKDNKDRCDICGEPGGEGEDELGEIDMSVNDDKVVHRKCWTRDPEASSWTSLRPKNEDKI
jgi:hypothetical protein